MLFLEQRNQILNTLIHNLKYVINLLLSFKHKKQFSKNYRRQIQILPHNNLE